jgi:hypothetical protein
MDYNYLYKKNYGRKYILLLQPEKRKMDSGSSLGWLVVDNSYL